MTRVVWLGVAVAALVGCARRPAQTATQVVVDVRTETLAPRAGDPPQRLDHVVTLGHDTNLPGARPVAAAGAAAPLVIQNNITVNQAPAWGGVGYGYPYGRYGYSTPTYPTYSTFRSAPVNPVTGTPPVAGDWPAPPSYGPRPMR